MQYKANAPLPWQVGATTKLLFIPLLLQFEQLKVIDLQSLTRLYNIIIRGSGNSLVVPEHSFVLFASTKLSRTYVNQQRSAHVGCTRDATALTQHEVIGTSRPQFERDLVS